MTDDSGHVTSSSSGTAPFGAPKPPRVVAIFVAYNSPAAVERCLRSLDAQERPVDGVLIVDNSQPRALDLGMLDIPILTRTRVIETGSNLGPAGGFALGLAAFMEDGHFTHAWLMDDDCYPDATALALMLEVAERTRAGAAIFPSSVHEATGEVSIHPGWIGILIDRLAVRLAGLPRADLFWGTEDTEYLQYRLPRRGVAVVDAPEARVVYDLVRRVGGRPSWKYYFEVRNIVWYRLEVQRGSSIRKLPRSLIRLFGAALLSKDRVANLRMFMKGLGHGLLGRLGWQVKPPVPHVD